MTPMNLARLALAGAALLLSAMITAPSQAGSALQALPKSTMQTADAGLIDVGYYRRGYHRGYGHRRGGVSLFFAPVIVGGGYYGYDRYREGYRGPSCYSLCREEHGPEFCRYNWRRYC